MKIFGYGHQNITEDDIAAVTAVLRSDYLTQGPKLEEFEADICRYTGAKYCVAVSSATAALHIAMLAAGIKNGDEVITTPNTFVASANCARYVGADVAFTDIDSATANIDVNKISVNDKTKAIIPVHFAGQSCDMEAIQKLAGKSGAAVIEDASHAIGSEYKGTKVGSCAYSDMTIFSFHPVKTITTGEGGTITTNDEKLFEKLRHFRAHGITKDSKKMSRCEGPWFYEMQELGFNYRMTEMQAALGISQLKRLEVFKQRRRAIVDLYKKLLNSDSRVRFLREEKYSCACFHLCPVLIDFEKLKIKKETFFEELRIAGLNLQVHYIPVYWQPYYKKMGYEEGLCPNAEKYYRQAVSLPLYPDLSDADVEEIVDRFVKVLDKCGNLA
jgi:UDP-4-amino-4,6-dideoxy-N-acetyl-beta-L-altrosamine transaminase